METEIINLVANWKEKEALTLIEKEFERKKGPIELLFRKSILLQDFPFDDYHESIFILQNEMKTDLLFKDLIRVILISVIEQIHTGRITQATYDLLNKKTSSYWNSAFDIVNVFCKFNWDYIRKNIDYVFNYLKVYPNIPRWYLFLAEFYEKWSQYEKAKKYYKKAICLINKTNRESALFDYTHFENFLDEHLFQKIMSDQNLNLIKKRYMSMKA